MRRILIIFSILIIFDINLVIADDYIAPSSIKDFLKQQDYDNQNSADNNKQPSIQEIFDKKLLYSKKAHIELLGEEYKIDDIKDFNNMNIKRNDGQGSSLLKYDSNWFGSIMFTDNFVDDINRILINK